MCVCYFVEISVRMASPLSLVFLLVIHRVSSAGWGVSYSHSQICALKDSSVIMSCTYTYPTEYKIRKVFWTKTVKDEDSREDVDLSKDPEYSRRLQYLGDKQKNCTIRLSHVTKKDSHMYYFRFTTNKLVKKWLGDPGVSLTVTDLQVESPERVTEGDSVRLTCKSSCTLTDRATFIWYRNSQPITERRDRNNQLLLQSVRREDAGRYSCALKEHTYISPAVQLSVTCEYILIMSRVSTDSLALFNNLLSLCLELHFSFVSSLDPPKSVSVSVSAEIVEGDSVTLMCSSDSNPPALNFSWFKENQSSSVGSGQSFSALQSGRFYCEAHNQHGSQRSDTVTVTVHHLAGKSLVFVVTVASGGVFIIIIIIIILFTIQRKRMNRRSAAHEYENNDPSASTYMTLDLKSSSSDVYNTLTSVHPRPAVHQSSSSEYRNQSVSIRSRGLLYISSVVNRYKSVLK
uniref:B-cell receptor CD22 n=1 Tax=Cyprinus carpio TaxID=7962 RepID=A0A8C2J7T5_CYPCA